MSVLHVKSFNIKVSSNIEFKLDEPELDPLIIYDECQVTSSRASYWYQIQTSHSQASVFYYSSLTYRGMKPCVCCVDQIKPCIVIFTSCLHVYLLGIKVLPHQYCQPDKL